MNTNPYSRPWITYTSPPTFSSPSTSQYPPTWPQQPPGPPRPPLDPIYTNYGYGPYWNPTYLPHQQFPNSHSQTVYSPYQPVNSQPVIQPVRPISIPQPLYSSHGATNSSPYHSQNSSVSSGHGATPGPKHSHSQLITPGHVPRSMRVEQWHTNLERSVQRGKNDRSSKDHVSKPIPSGPRNPIRSVEPPTGPRSRQFPSRNRARQFNHQRRRSALNKSKSDPSFVSAVETNVSKLGFSNRQDNRRSLTDFKLVGWTVCELDWTWGNGDNPLQTTPNFREPEAEEEPTTRVGGGSDIQVNKKATQSNRAIPTSCRLRFYFQPLGADPRSGESSTLVAGKRKKCEEEEEEDMIRKTRRRYSPMHLSSADESGKLSVEHSEPPGFVGDLERASETDDSDWLLKAIGEDASEGGTVPHSPFQVEPAEVRPSAVSLDSLHESKSISCNEISSELATSSIPQLSENISDSDAGMTSINFDHKEEGPGNISFAGEKVSQELADLAEAHVNASHEIPVEQIRFDQSTQTGTSMEEAIVENSHGGVGSDFGMEPSKAEQDPVSQSEPTRLEGSGTVLQPQATPTNPQKPILGGPSNVVAAPSQNRISLLYADSQRRLTIEAAIVEKVDLFRSEGRIEICVRYPGFGKQSSGIKLETFSQEYQDFIEWTSKSDEGSDPTIPPFARLETTTSLTLVLFLDTKRPLSEPGWCKSGNVEEWLAREFGRAFIPSHWKNKICVVDPDRPPSLDDIIASWCTHTSVGTQETRNRFRETELIEPSKMFQILFRVVRGERTYPNSFARLDTNLSENPTLPASLQTPSVLAISSIIDIALDFSRRAMGSAGAKEAQRRVIEVIEKLPTTQLHRALDAMFREYRG